MVVFWVPGRRARLLAAAVALSLVVLLFARAVPVATTPLAELLTGRTVVIDPGHGGPDPGCTKGGLVEKELTLDLAKRVAERFRQAAMRPVLTREGDCDLGDPSLTDLRQRKRDDLRRRAALAESCQADLFLSLHANSFPSPVWSGAQVFYHQDSEAGRKLASALQDVLVEELRELGPNPRREKAADFYLLARVKRPAAMVEVGFLSNPREAALLADEEYRDRLATAIFHGAVRHLAAAATGREAGPRSREANSGGPRELEQQRRWQAVADRGPDEVVLYFAGPTNGEDWLIPELRLVRGFAGLPLEKRLETAVQELAKGPGPGSALLGVLPEGTRVRRVALAPGLVTVDLRPGFGTWTTGSYTEALAVYSVVNTVAELAPDCQVRLLIAGEAPALGHLALPEALKPAPALALPGRNGAAGTLGSGRRRFCWWDVAPRRSFSVPSSSLAP
ncbi:MAG: N-acetylmuramoyl-L-alanine amidase [Chitinophagales bacterium]